MRKRFEKNELLLRIVAVVFISIISVILATSIVVFQHAKAVYIKSYASSNAILLEKFKKETDRISEDATTMLDEMTSPIVANFLMQKYSSPVDEARVNLEFTKFIKPTGFLHDNIISNLVLLSVDGKSFYHNSSVHNTESQEILKSQLIETAKNSPNLMTYSYASGGLSVTTQNVPGIIFVRKLYNSNKQLYGFATIFIQEDQLRELYSTSVDGEIDKIFLVNRDNLIQSTNSNLTLNQKLPAKFLKGSNAQYEILTQKVNHFDYKFVSVIDKKALAANMNLIQPLSLIVIASILFVGTGAYLIIRRATQPIYNLIEHIPKASSGDFSHRASVEGTHEVRELAVAYNHMLANLADYFDQVIHLENEKRLSEINALQMQIQPHFIYNTLATIKFFFYQDDAVHGIAAIDSFTQLLRYTLSQSDSWLTLAEEVDYLKNYATIMHLRFGDNIHTNFMLDTHISQAKIPKMLLQPIIENAFLHAFPDQREGFINVFITLKTAENEIRIEIMDNGIGICTGEEEVTDSKKGISYTSLGLKNSRSRIQLLYGNLGNLEIESVLGQGTNVIVTLPYQKIV
ncbi:histidine kinase [Lactococcus hodotermopsidis]|uniref:histidine kinase n=1 Tax=Pseudolactococcus hodotermopsidis TaxID=2709157 RepID=A0A6A0BEE8_9LACT|nr:histidine kinase [Lactococcus hodotermopsidis]GFH42721.1 histidine kinase [Lactococcus hodotermopsidis]